MKKLIFISVTLISLGVFCSFYNTSSGLTGTYTPNQNDSLKLEAFTVLENNCNECHIDKKPKYVFTLANMNAHCADINTQVFLKRKMPKGKENVLTKKDEQTLKNWIDSYFAVLKKKN